MAYCAHLHDKNEFVDAGRLETLNGFFGGNGISNNRGND
jgi:hypothetical protein